MGDDAELEQGNVEELNVKGIIGFDGSTINGLLVHPNGKHVVYPLGNKVVIQNWNTKKQHFLTGHTNIISSIAMSVSGKFLASGQINHIGFKARVIIWDFKKRELLAQHEHHKVRVEAVAFSKDERYVISLGGRDCGTGVVWDMLKSQVLCGSQVSRGVQGDATCIQTMTRRGACFLTAGDNHIAVWKINQEARNLKSFDVSMPKLKRVVVCLDINERDEIPTSPEEWLTKTNGFSFPHCLGAIDGKHITIIAPAEYFNYKGCFSIVSLALVDSDYCFQFADIGSQERISDGGVLNQSNLWQKICDGTLNLPPSCPLPGNNTDMPYVSLGNGAFALSTHIMKPFSGHHLLGSPERMFNQQLSRSRAVVENSFGILSSVFRIFHRPILLDVVKTSIITHSCLLLHNFLRKSKSSRNIYTPPGSTDTYDINNELIRRGLRANHEENLLPLQSVPRRPPFNVTQVRLNFMNYIHQRGICSSSRANDV